MMKIYVVRHCATEYSTKKIYCGSTDIPLSAQGEAEAKRLFETARRCRFDLIFSSPMLRARQTAEAIGRDVPILYDERLGERRFGEFERTSAERADGRPCRYNFAVKYPGGESNLQVAARVYAFLGEVTEKYAGKALCIVSHGSVCRLIRTYFREMTDEEFYSYSQPTGMIEEYEL